MSKKFRKLDIDLPRQPLADQRPWEVAGIVLVLLLLVFAILSYYQFSADTEVLPAGDYQSGKP